MFLELTYSRLCKLYEKEKEHFSAQKEDKKARVKKHAEIINLIDTEGLGKKEITMLLRREIRDDGEEVENSTDGSSSTLVCNVCENRKVTVVKHADEFYVLTDFMNTVPVTLHKEKKGEYVIGIGYLHEKGFSRPEIEVLAKDRGVVVGREDAYIVEKKCKHIHACTEKENLCVQKNSKDYLEHLLYCSLKRIVEEKEDLFISFSGGIDSLLCATLCSKYFTDKRIYLINTCFSKDSVFLSRDRESAREFYKKIVCKYRGECILLENNIDRESILQSQSTISRISKDTTMDFNLAALHYFTAQKAKEFGGGFVITGTGGDELFMGYSKHREIVSENMATDDRLDGILQGTIEKDAKVFWKTNLHRDYAAGAILSVIPVSPFLDPEVFDHSMATARKSGIKKKQLTDILQKAYPGSVFKKKLAGQYGSGIADVIRSIKCRAPSLCKRNECLSLECSKRYA